MSNKFLHFCVLHGMAGILGTNGYIIQSVAAVWNAELKAKKPLAVLEARVDCGFHCYIETNVYPSGSRMIKGRLGIGRK